MDRDAIVLTLDLAPGASGYTQRVAGFELWCDRPLGPSARPAARPRLDVTSPCEEETVVFDGLALDGGHLRRVVAAIDGAGERRVEFDDGESFRVAADGGSVRRWRAPAVGDDAGRTLERALGAPLALALAARGVHLLHASALALGDAAVALTAESGVGKSTLAASADPDGAWRRIADDLLPVRLGLDPRALPHFPQLKLAPAEEYPASAPLAVRLAAVVELDRGPEDGPLALERLDPAAAALVLARATAAALLFDASLLGAHLAACAASAGHLTVARLHYPSGRSHLP
ncbi:MAG TPA: hypothetical protein VI942_05540, partial [Thermoanaerobaculia bacterium]|nr:hypothetical protein [Thermoanaerobaculia bacterium]